MLFHCRELHTFMVLSLGHIFLSMRMKSIAICLSWELEPPIRLSFISRRLLLKDRILSLMFWNMLPPSHLLRNQGSPLTRCGSNALLCFFCQIWPLNQYIFPRLKDDKHRHIYTDTKDLFSCSLKQIWQCCYTSFLAILCQDAFTTTAKRYNLSIICRGIFRIFSC